MCLITEQKRVKILKEDLVVYKRLFNYTENPIAIKFNFEYELNKLYKTKLVADNHPDSYCGVDVANAYGFCMTDFDRVAKTLTNVHDGFHFGTSVKKMRNTMAWDSTSIYKCIVPKDSRVYFDKTGLGVANQIKIIRKL